MKTERERIFACPDCEQRLTAWKLASRMTPIGHKKTMWCPYCKRVETFTQVECY